MSRVNFKKLKKKGVLGMRGVYYCSGCALYRKTLEQGTRNLPPGFIVCPHTRRIVGAADVACMDGYMITHNPHRLQKTCDPDAIAALAKVIEEMKREKQKEMNKKQKAIQLLLFNATDSYLYPQNLQRGL